MQNQVVFTGGSSSICDVDVTFGCECNVGVLIQCSGVDAMFGCCCRCNVRWRVGKHAKTELYQAQPRLKTC